LLELLELFFHGSGCLVGCLLCHNLPLTVGDTWYILVYNWIVSMHFFATRLYE